MFRKLSLQKSNSMLHGDNSRVKQVSSRYMIASSSDLNFLNPLNIQNTFIYNDSEIKTWGFIYLFVSININILLFSSLEKGLPFEHFSEKKFKVQYVQFLSPCHTSFLQQPAQELRSIVNWKIK